MGGWGNEDSFSDYTVLYDLTKTVEDGSSATRWVNIILAIYNNENLAKWHNFLPN